jgi:hypothetical protein
VELVFYGASVAAFVCIAASLALVAARRIDERSLVVLAALLGAGALLAGGALVANAISRFADYDAIIVATAGLASAAVAELGLAALVRASARLRDEERLLSLGSERIAAQIDTHAAERARELEQVLARERGNAAHLLGQQERRLGLERRDLVARQADRARAELAQSIEQVQQRLEQRLAAWAADLDRGQRSLESRLNQLAQRQSEAIQAYEARLAADSDHLRTVTEEQQAALARLRTELELVGRELLEENRAEMEAHADERRRALQELSARLRDAEREVREAVDRETAESIARIQTLFVDVERRQRENLERSLERAGGRLAEDAERRFDAQIRQSREKSAQRLSNELEKAMDQFARRAEKEIADRIAEAAQATAVRVERRVTEATRAAEVQHEVAAERLRTVRDRLNEALVDAERRIDAFEAQIETEVSAKVEQLERTIRAADV